MGEVVKSVCLTYLAARFAFMGLRQSWVPCSFIWKALQVPNFFWKVNKQTAKYTLFKIEINFAKLICKVHSRQIGINLVFFQGDRIKSKCIRKRILIWQLCIFLSARGPQRSRVECTFNPLASLAREIGSYKMFSWVTSQKFMKFLDI